MQVAAVVRSSLLLVLAIAACGCAAPTSDGQTSSGTTSRPPVPDGWIRLTAADREAAVTVPSQLRIQDDQSGILAGFHDPAEAISSLGVLGIGPTAMVSQPTEPFAEAALVDWLLENISNRRPDAYTQASVLLPAGPAVEVRFRFDTGTPDEVAVIGYAVQSSRGVAFLTANCQAKPMTMCEEFLSLVPLLFELNLPDGG